MYWDPHTEMPGQVYSWTCSACALEWVKRATDLIGEPGDIYESREVTVYEIGYPDQINPAVGLTNKDGPGAALQKVLEETYGQGTKQGYLDYDSVYDLAHTTTAMMSGAVYYHWVALRGVSGSNLWIANSAPGYKGVWDILSRADFERLGGWNVVWLEA